MSTAHLNWTVRTQPQSRAPLPSSGTWCIVIVHCIINPLPCIAPVPFLIYHTITTIPSFFPTHAVLHGAASLPVPLMPKHQRCISSWPTHAQAAAGFVAATPHTKVHGRCVSVLTAVHVSLVSGSHRAFVCVCVCGVWGDLGCGRPKGEVAQFGATHASPRSTAHGRTY